MDEFICGVAITRAGRTLYFCSIECARHNGFEPDRLRLPQEYDEPCTIDHEGGL